MRIAFQFHRIRCDEPGARNPYSNICDLCAMDLDGGNRVVLFEDIYFQQSFYFSADASRTAFEGPRTKDNHQTYGSIALDGSDRRELTFLEYAAHGKYSLDGRYIALGTFLNVYILDAATGKLHVKIPQPNCQDVHWLADGRLGFCTWSDRTQYRPRRGYFTVMPDDPTLRQLSPKGMDLGPCAASPDGRHIAMRMDNGVGLHVMSLDGSKVWELTTDRYGFGTMHWSPDGTRIVTDVAPKRDSGLDVFDLRDGSRKRIAPYGFSAQDWLPDSSAVLCYWDRWQDPKKYSGTSLDDLQLVAADGSSTRALTTDGRSGQCSFQPSPGAQRLSPPSALPADLSWAKVIYEEKARAAELAANDPLNIARWAQILADPEAGMPFPVRVGVQSTPAAPEKEVSDFMIEGCAHIPDAIVKLEAALNERKLAKSGDFALIYPRFAVAEENEHTVHYIAGLILEEAQKRRWGFERDLPEPKWE